MISHTLIFCELIFSFVFLLDSQILLSASFSPKSYPNQCLQPRMYLNFSPCSNSCIQTYSYTAINITYRKVGVLIIGLYRDRL